MTDRFIRYEELKPIVGGVSNVTLWRWEKVGKFPKRVKIGPSAAGWLESEVNDWMQRRAADHRQA